MASGTTPVPVFPSDSIQQHTTMNNTNVTQEHTAEAGFDEILAIGLGINKYYLWVVLAFGFPGNLATIITIFRIKSLGSFAFYVVVLAVMDNLALSVKIIIYQLLSNQCMGSSTCRFFGFMGNFLPTYANWVLVMMAVERLIAVCFPFRITHFLGFRKSALALTIVGLVIAGLYSPVIWVMFYNESTLNCEMSQTSPHLKSFMNWINISLYAFIPFIVLSFCNLLIAKEIRSSFRVRSALRNVSTMTLRSRCIDMTLQRQIMLMLFASTMIFVVFVFPICALAVASNYWTVQPYTREYGWKYLLDQLAFVLCDSTHAVNFYLYFLSARKFRSSFTYVPQCVSAMSRTRSAAL